MVSCCRYSDIEGGWPSRKWIQPLGRVSSSPVSGARGSRSASPLASILRTVLWCQSPTEVPCLWEEACESQKSATEALVWPQREPGWHWTSPPSRADRGAAATSLLAAVALRRAASLAAPPRRMAPASTQARYRPRPPWCVCNACRIFLFFDLFIFGNNSTIRGACLALACQNTQTTLRRRARLTLYTYCQLAGAFSRRSLIVLHNPGHMPPLAFPTDAQHELQFVRRNMQAISQTSVTLTQSILSAGSFSCQLGSHWSRAPQKSHWALPDSFSHGLPPSPSGKKETPPTA